MTIKEIKQDAKVRITGKYLNLIIINVLYSLFSVTFTYLASSVGEQLDSPILSTILSIVLIILMLPFSYGVIASTMKIIHNEDASSTEFINIGLKNISRVWKLTLRTFLKLIVPFILLVISIVFSAFCIVSTMLGSTESSALLLLSIILYFVVIIYFCIKSLSYALSYYLLYDNSDKRSVEILNESEKLMKGNKWKYIGLNLSFIGWYILIYLISYFVIAIISSLAGSIVTFVLTAILTPYIISSQIGFYEDLKDSNVSNEQENNN